MRTGVRWYVGCPASGKTTLARAHAIRLASANRWPVLVLDTEGAAQLAGFHRSRTVAEAVRIVWSLRRSTSVVPRDGADVLALLKACHKPGRVVLLVDEAHVWMTSAKGGEVRAGFLRLMRSHRHSRVLLLLTTQHLSGDIPQPALACAPRMHVFRCTSPATLERLRSSFGLDPERVRALRQFAYLEFSEGFDSGA